jgi:hypothetical protein
MDDNGHFNIPKGEPVAWFNSASGSPNIVIPKEVAEFDRAQTAKLLADRVANNVSTPYDTFLLKK